jgi:hypothetical protein
MLVAFRQRPRFIIPTGAAAARLRPQSPRPFENAYSAGLDERGDDRPIFAAAVRTGEEAFLRLRAIARSFCPCWAGCRSLLSLARAVRPAGSIALPRGPGRCSAELCRIRARHGHRAAELDAGSIIDRGFRRSSPSDVMGRSAEGRREPGQSLDAGGGRRDRGGQR